MSEVDNQRALVYILDDELACLKADLFAASEIGEYDTIIEIRGLIRELIGTRACIIKAQEGRNA